MLFDVVSYQQKRYNLFNEETEGYSKLVTELLSFPTYSKKKKDIDKLKERIQSLIGYFDLDPNRVFDLVMDTAEIFLDRQPTNFMDLLSLFNRNNLGHIMGFKFRFYRGRKTPARLFKCAAMLIRDGYLNLIDLYPHLYPERDDQLRNKLFDFEQEKFEEAKHVGVVNLNQDSSEEPQAKAIDPRNDRQIPEIFVHNQKLGLLTALLKVGAYSDAINMLDSLSTATVPLSFHPSIANALCSALTLLIEPIYAKISPSRIMDPNYDVNERFECSESDAQLLSKLVFPLLYHLGPELHHDLLLFTKLVRVVNEFISYQQKGAHFSAKPEYLGALEVFLSALCFIPLNTGLVYEIWSILSQLNYESRFSVYTMTKDNGYTNNYKMMAQYNLASKEIKSVLKRLSKENFKTRGRAIARIAHSNPLVVADKICEICENYENLIPLIVEALRYVTPLLHDVMTFCIIQRFIKEPIRPKLKSDASSIAAWLANLATLIGYLFKKYFTTDLEPIINYVLNQVKRGGWEDLIILKELIQHMSGIEIIDDMIGLKQLHAHAGGDTLRAECGGFVTVASRLKRSVHKLRDSFLDAGKGKMLLLMTARLCSSIYSLHDESDIPDSYLKLVTESKDKSHEAFMLLLRFIEKNIPIFIQDDDVRGESSLVPSKSMKCIFVPPVQKIISYGIDVELAYGIVRKALNYVPSDNSFDEVTLNQEINRKIGNISNLISDDPRLWEVIPKDFYNAFWSLGLYDVFVPVQTYNNKLQEIPLECEAAKAASTPPSTKKKEIDKLEITASKLKEELAIQNQNHQRVLELIRAKKDKFFQGLDEKVVNRDFMTYFCQYCIIPRFVMSSADALYCAKFVELVHNEQVPMFNTLQYLSVVLGKLAPSYLICATEQESRRLATLLLSNFIMLDQWTSSEEQFKQHCDKIGFNRDVITNERVGFKEFTSKIIPSIHITCTQKFLFCLRGEQHQNLKNSLIVVLILGNSGVYPKYKKHAAELLTIVDKLRESEYDDISTSAKRYHSILVELEKKLPVDEPEPIPVVVEPAKQEVTTKPLNPDASPINPAPPSAPLSTPQPPAESLKNDEQPSAPKPEQSAADEIRKKLLLHKESTKDKKDTRRDSKGEPYDVRQSRDRGDRGGKRRESLERDNRDMRRESRDGRDSRDSRDGGRDRSKDSQKLSDRSNDRDRKSSDDRRSSRDNRDNRDSRDGRDSRDNRDNRENRDSRDNRDRDSRDSNRESSSRDSRGDNRDSRGTKRERDQPLDSFKDSRDMKRRRDDYQDNNTPPGRDDNQQYGDSSFKKDRKRIRRPEIK